MALEPGRWNSSLGDARTRPQTLLSEVSARFSFPSHPQAFRYLGPGRLRTRFLANHIDLVSHGVNKWVSHVRGGKYFFQHGVKFDLTIATGDTFAAATVSSLLSAAVIYKKMSGDQVEKAALAATDISSNSGLLNIHFATSDGDFNSLLNSSLFQSMVH